MDKRTFQAAANNLTKHQERVLKQMLSGESDEHIASNLSISLGTYRKHIQKIGEIFGFKTISGERTSKRIPLCKIYLEHKPDLVGIKAREKYIEAGSPNPTLRYLNQESELSIQNTVKSPSINITPKKLVNSDIVDISIPSQNFATYNPKHWIGREDLIENLLSRLRESTHILWITGISGIGKTTLGGCLASQTWKTNQSFQWIYLEILEGENPDFNSVAIRLLTKLGDCEFNLKRCNKPEELIERLLKKLQSCRYWIQIDSLERLLSSRLPNEFIDAYWKTFLERCLTETDFNSRFVLTAQSLPKELVEFSDRYPNTWVEHRLKGILQIEQQLEFFIKRGISVIPSNQDIFNRIARIYQGHPLVLKVISEEVLNKFKGNITHYWQIYRSEFEELSRGLQVICLDDCENNEALDSRVRERIKKSLKQILSENALDLLCRSSVFRCPVPKKFWWNMMGDYTSDQIKLAYQILDNSTLIEKEGTNIRQHNLIRSIAYNLLKATPQRWEKSERQAAHLWLTAYKTEKTTPNLEIVRGYLEAFDHYYEVKDWEKVKDIFMTPIKNIASQEVLYSQLDVWGYYHEEIYLCERLLGKFDQQIDVFCFKGLGNAWLDLSKYQKSIDSYIQSLTIARSIGDRESEGYVLANLGIVYYWKGEYPTAVQFLLDSLQIKRMIGNPERISNTLGTLGLVYVKQGENENYIKALECYQEALEIACETGYRKGEGNFLSNLGEVQIKLGQYKCAEINLCNALEILGEREIGDRANEAIALKNLADLYYKWGKVDLARMYCKKALSLATKLGIPLVAECEQLQQEIEIYELPESRSVSF